MKFSKDKNVEFTMNEDTMQILYVSNTERRIFQFPKNYSKTKLATTFSFLKEISESQRPNAMHNICKEIPNSYIYAEHKQGALYDKRAKVETFIHKKTKKLMFRDPWVDGISWETWANV